jgi:hypothetical protein
LYQPFAFAARDAAAVAWGAVESYFNGRDAAPVLPAWSRHVPPMEVEALSGPA